LKKNNIQNILIIAFIIRFVLLLVNNYIFILPQGGGDAIGFESRAYLISISDYSEINLVDILSSGVRLYNLLISFVYYIIGRHPIILGLTNVSLGTYLVYLVYRATLLLWNNRTNAIKAAWFTTFFPLLMVESALILRELPIMVASMLGIISFIKFWKYNQKTKIFGFIIFTFIAALFHSGVLFIFIGYILFINFQAKGSNFFTKIFSIALVVLALYIMNETGIGTNKIGGSFDKSIELLQKREQYDVHGGSHYPEWMRLSGNNMDLVKIPVRYITFLFSPLIPWLVRSLWHSVGLIDAILYLLMFYVILKNRKIFKFNETAKAVFVMILLTALVFSLGVTNVGTAIRHRAKIAPLLIVLTAGMNKEQLQIYYQQYLEYKKKYLKKYKK